MKKKVGIIGYGNMGQAIGERIKRKYTVYAFDKIKNITSGNITVVNNSVDLVKQSEVVILAVKPQDFDALFDGIKPYMQDKLVISIAAGITTAYIEKVLNAVRVVRVMPNIAVKIAKGETGICKGRYAEGEDLVFTKELFSLLGKVWEVQEGMIDSVTAISGSGPAYIFYDMEINKLNPLRIPAEIKKGYVKKLKEAAIEVGFDPEMALNLAVSITASTMNLIKKTGDSPTQLRKMITSAGGTTEAAIKVITNGGSWSNAAVAAKKRAQELSKKE